MIKRTAGGIIIGNGGRVVVVSQNFDSWSLPKGGIEKGEDELDAARREIFEETGLYEITLVERLGSYTRPRGGNGENKKRIKHLTFFLFTTTQIELQPIDPINPEAIWLYPEEVGSRLSHPKDVEFYVSQIPKIQELAHKSITDIQ